MNRFVIIDGLPYLCANDCAVAVRWDEHGFTVGGQTDKVCPSHPRYSETEVKAKCAVLDSIGEPEGSQDNSNGSENPDSSKGEQEPEGSQQESTPAEDVEDVSFEDMTRAELIAYAAENDIDLNGASRKADILAAIQKAVS